MTRREEPVLVLWDVDNTLLSTGGVSRVLYTQAFLRVIGRAPDALPDMAGRMDRAIVADTLAMHGLASSEETFEAFYAALAIAAEGLRDRMRAEGERLPGAREAVAGLAGDGVVQTVVTGNIRPIAATKLAALDLTEHLDLEIGGYGSDGESRGPVIRKAWWRAAAKYRLSFSPARVVVVGDTRLDVLGAREAGAYAVGVSSGRCTADELKAAGADAVISDLFEIEEIVATLRAA